MSVSRITLCILAVLVVLVVGASAGGVDLTGTYEGKLRFFEAANDGSEDTGKEASTARITQNPDDSVNVEIDGELYQGRIIEWGGNPEKFASGVILACGTDDDPNTPSGMAIMEAKVNAAKGRGKLRALGVLVDSLGLGVANGKWKRVDTADPMVADCP